jgi:hypothetical protein
MNTRFEVSAEWMKACGFGDAAKVFDVLFTQEFRGVNPDFGTMLTLDDGTPTGWTVAICRGRIVPLPTYEQMAERARALHQENFDRAGDAYATAEELEYLLDDPLANYEMVYPQLTVETGAFIEKGTRSVVWATKADLEYCEQRMAETRASRQERSPDKTMTQEQIDAAVSNATHAAFEALVASNIPMPADHLTALYSLSNYLEQFVREVLDA